MLKSTVLLMKFLTDYSRDFRYFDSRQRSNDRFDLRRMQQDSNQGRGDFDFIDNLAQNVD